VYNLHVNIEAEYPQLSSNPAMLLLSGYSNPLPGRSPTRIGKRLASSVIL